MKRIVGWKLTGLGVTLTLSLALVSAAFGQETDPVASNAPAQIVSSSPASPAPMPVMTDLSRRSPDHAAREGIGTKEDVAKDRWWISETVAQSQKDQPVFFGVRLANAPQAALVETYRQAYTAGETLAVRLWGCNDLPREFKGRVRVALKRGDKQFASEEKTVRLAPETAKCLAKYSFATEELAAGQYVLETSLFDNADELVQRQVTTVTVRVTQKQEARRQAQAAEKAQKEAELKAKADLERRSALAKAEAEKQAAEAEQKAVAEAQAKKSEMKAKQEAEKQAAADLKAQAQAAEKAKKEAELKAKADLSRRSALAQAEAEQKVADDLSRRSALAKAEKQAAADLKAQALAAEKAKKDVELKAKADQSRRSALAKAEAKKQAAEADLSRRSALAQAEAAKKAADQKVFEETRAKYLAQEKDAIAVKAQELARQEAKYQAKVTQAEAEQQAAEMKAAALALEAKTAQAVADAKAADETRMKQRAK